MRTKAELYERNAFQAPDRVAMIFEGQQRTYREFLSRIMQLGSAIERTGLPRQGRVGIFAANSLAHYEAAAAAEYGAYIPAMFNFRLAAPELAMLIAQSEPEVLFFGPEFADVVHAATRDHRGIRRFVVFGDSGPDWATPYEAFLAEGSPAGPSLRPRPEEVATLFFTGGTTGLPRGVPWGHEASLRSAQLFQPPVEDIVVLQVSPAFHIGGRGPVTTAMWTRGTVVLERSFDATRWLELVSRHRVNWTFMVPAMMQAVLDHPQLATYDISSLEFVMAASTAIPPELLQRAVDRMGRIFYVAYGSTEGGAIAKLRRSETRADGGPVMTARLASVGQVNTWCDVLLLGEDDKPVPIGEVGEVCSRNVVFTEYWNDPVATKEVLFGDGYVRTGDMGRYDEEGYLYLVDRKKDMIISGGENIFCREVELALDQHPAIRSVAVIGQPDEKWGETVFALIIREDGHELGEDEVIAFGQSRLARFKAPKRVEFVDAFPMTAAGKIDKVALRRQYT